MTFEELATALEKTGATVTLTFTPVLRGPVPPEVWSGLKTHRERIIEALRHFEGARLEGLTCAACVPAAVAGQPVGLRLCPDHGWQKHYPRVP